MKKGIGNKAAAWALVFCGLSGCATAITQRPTTRMTAGDFSDMVAQMANDLLNSSALNRRRPNSPPWVIAVQKVTNLSSDVMTAGEQWSIMARIVDAVSIQRLDALKNIRFVLPAKQLATLRNSSATGEALPPSFGNQRAPTHVMTAVFRSLTRADSMHRTDVYVLFFKIINLRTGQEVWQGRFEYKRAATGQVWD